MRPVAHGMCHYESLKDGTLNMLDIGIMNDHLDLIAYNKMLAQNPN